ncbi:hypothetical protein KA977_10075 [Candidatus Dependentiae bacterium]|nr:hypothetical protein [Candidatus Dependentiae bacterium]
MKITIDCPVCRQKLRIPLTKGKLKITCPRCAAIFFYEFRIPNILKNLKNFFSEAFKKPDTKFSHSTVNYTDFKASRQIGKLFLIWILVLIGFFLASVFLKHLNDKNLIAKYNIQKSDETPAQPYNDFNEDSDNDNKKHNI